MVVAEIIRCVSLVLGLFESLVFHKLTSTDYLQ